MPLQNLNPKMHPEIHLPVRNVGRMTVWLGAMDHIEAIAPMDAQV
jgi:hypothetical protein